MTTEKIPMFIVYKDNGTLKAEVCDDADPFEVYGFLEPFVSRMKKQLENSMEDKE